MKLLRIYADTSVIGGYFDPEFETDSRRLLDGVKQARCLLLLSQVVLDELVDAPERVRQLLTILPSSQIETVEITSEVTKLCQAYLTASILTARWIDDATHVAAATVAKADAIVSWNFKHIVRLDKMTAYNQINQLHGYGALTIISPREVFFDEPEKEFDCLAYKREVQLKIYEKIKNLTAEEQAVYFQQAVETGPFAEWWKSLRQAAPTVSTS